MRLVTTRVGKTAAAAPAVILKAVLALLPLLLYCRLANEITNLSDAATLYPLFGLGANLAQALAGLVLKVRLAACSLCSGDSSGHCTNALSPVNL